MCHSIFLNDFPLVQTFDELEEVKSRFPQLDPCFVASGCIKERRDKFNNLWNQFKPLSDRHFLSEIKVQFHQRSWEMYVGCALKKYFTNVFSENDGPDFIINKNKTSEMFIEAVACQRGNSDDRVPVMKVTDNINDIVVQVVPEKEMLLRLANALMYKANKYKKFIKSIKRPYIIAVNIGDLGYRADSNIPLILKCLFGLGYQQFTKTGYVGWSRRQFIEKLNGEQVSMLFFEQEENNFVSGVIYSSNNILNSLDNIGSDCLLIHNPKAQYPVDLKSFSFFEQWEAKKVDSGFSITRVKN